jgi:hypothetical protein
MTEKSKDFLQKAAIAGLTVPAGLMGGEMISDAMEGQLTKAERNGKRAEDVQRLKEKFKDAKEPTGSGKESLSKSPSYKSGGSVRSASSRADGCAIRGKTRA